MPNATEEEIEGWVGKNAALDKITKKLYNRLVKIYKTKDYDKFKLIKGNRKYNEKHILDLAEALTTVNLLANNPIIVNEDMKIIDGQHRLEAAKLADVEVYYTIMEGANLSNVILLNSLSKNWTLWDYLESFIERGREDYRLIKEFCEAYETPISYALSLLNKTDDRSNPKKFKNGTYQVNNLHEANELMETLKPYREYCEGKVYLSRDFIRAMRRLLKEGVMNSEQMLHKLEVSGFRIHSTTNLPDMYRQLEDIYNYRSRDKIRFF